MATTVKLDEIREKKAEFINDLSKIPDVTSVYKRLCEIDGEVMDV